MEYFAHIFIGKEFAETVSNIAVQIVKYGGEDVLSSVNLFVIADNNVRRVLYPEKTNVMDVVFNSPSLQVNWMDIGKLTKDIEHDKDLFLNEIFNRIVNVSTTRTNGTLYCILHFPLYKENALKDALSLYRIIKLTERPVEVDFMGYCDDLSHIIEPGYVISSPSKNQVKEYVRLRDNESIGYSTHFIAMQNTSQNGISLNLDVDSFARILAHFSILFAGHYHQIFPSTMKYLDAVTLGLSNLYLDRYLFTEYLLNKSLLNAMDVVQVNDMKVNTNDAHVIANDMLKDKTSLLSAQFAEIDKLKNFNEDDEFRKVQEILAKEVQGIVDRCKQTLEEQKTVTMHAAILAVCLAKTDCELFSETIFSQNVATVDELFNEPIDYYINNDYAHYYKLNGEDPVNPIKTFKELDTSLINSETTIRNLRNSLAELSKQIGDSQKVTDCYVENGYVHFDNRRFRLLPSVEQEPLVETYKPHKVNVASLDMRYKFTRIKNQGQQGSCLSFSLTSIFEYIMQLNSAEEFDLSESFLYYNARNLDEDGTVNEDSGSRFKPSIDSLVKYGIALERIWPYKENIYNEKPSDEAYADGAKRKLVSAMNVNLKVDDIKSALVDNCPVAASFTLTQSFFEHGRVDGYIPMPSEEEIRSGLEQDSNDSLHGRHAMVIVGFSDELQMFIVRNSWGEDWGDHGYCYIPYSYIEHKLLFNYACILTEIENMVTTHSNVEIVPLRIDNNDLNIQYAIKRNELYSEEHNAEKLREEKNAWRIYFESLKQLYSNPNNRDRFINENIEHLSKEQESIEQNIKEKNNELDENDNVLKDYKKDIFFRAASFLTGTIFLALIYRQFVDFLHSGLGFTFKPFLFWLLVYAILAGVSYLLRKKSFVSSFWMSLWGLAGVLAVKSIIRLFRYFVGDESLISYFQPEDFFSEVNGGQASWLVAVFAVAIVIVLWKAHRVWQEWRENRDRIEAEIDKLRKEISFKEHIKKLFKIKTFSAWILITKLQALQTMFYSKYTLIIALINNLRTWYANIEAKGSSLSLDTTFPDTSLLSSSLLDQFFEKKLKNDPEMMLDFCGYINQYDIDHISLSQYQDTIINDLIKKLIGRKEIREFDISTHVASNASQEIALEVDRKLATILNEQSNIFMNVSSRERGLIIPFSIVFAPSLDQNRDALRKRLGNLSETYYESDNKYCMTFLKVATVYFQECVSLNNN